MSTITIKKERITPTMARQILDANNTGNRPVSPTRVAKYARDLMAKRWLETADTIKFDRDGRLLDGQHRLRALIEANVGYEFTVARGVEHAAFKAIDTGKSRCGSDVLVIEGMDPGIAQTVATAARLACGYEFGTPSSKGGAVLDGQASTRLDNAGTIEYVAKHPALVDAAKWIHTNRTQGALLSMAQLTWIFYETSRKNRDDAELFMMDLMHGTMLAASDPVHRLREVLIEERASKRKSGLEIVLAGVVKAWNKRRKGERITGLNRLLTRDWRSFPKFV